MDKKPTYGELEQRIEALEKAATKSRMENEALRRESELLLGGEEVGLFGSWFQEIETGREEWSRGEYLIHELSSDISPLFA